MTSEDQPKKGAEASEREAVADPNADLIKCLASFLLLIDIDANMMGVFLPGWFLQHGVTFTWIGILLAIPAVTNVIISPFMPYVIKRAGGPPKVFFWACLSFIPFRSCMLLLPLLESASAIFYAAAVIQVAAGCSAVAGSIAAPSWMLDTVPFEKRTESVALMASIRSSSALIGPALGGILYDAFGYTTTMLYGALAPGLALFVFRKTFYRLMNAYRIPALSKINKQGSIMQMPIVWFMGLLYLLSSSAIFWNVSFAQPFLMDAYGMTEWQIGLTFGVAGTVAYTLGAATGATVTKPLGQFPTMIAGDGLMSVGIMLFGPAPIFASIPHTSAWEPILALFVSTFGMAASSVVAEPLCLTVIELFGFSTGEATSQLLSWGTFFASFGAMLGSSLGGFSAETLGIPLTAQTVGLTMLLGNYALFLIVYILRPKDPASDLL
ncbi:hypothetical protein AB1Y20_000569 [Prymnesium parvum]|uniref:Major facilitator superfamily (MFS) profile domain-containing protein n=1 Tax=Prymnesium parvum TaxID=97485 RepID=A0AB34K8D7_PRYPA